MILTKLLTEDPPDLIFSNTISQELPEKKTFDPLKHDNCQYNKSAYGP